MVPLPVVPLPVVLLRVVLLRVVMLPVVLLPVVQLPVVLLPVVQLPVVLLPALLLCWCRLHLMHTPPGVTLPSQVQTDSEAVRLVPGNRRHTSPLHRGGLHTAEFIQVIEARPSTRPDRAQVACGLCHVRPGARTLFPVQSVRSASARGASHPLPCPGGD